MKAAPVFRLTHRSSVLEGSLHAIDDEKFAGTFGWCEPMGRRGPKPQRRPGWFGRVQISQRTMGACMVSESNFAVCC
jgi:hypothetical protein